MAKAGIAEPTHDGQPSGQPHSHRWPLWPTGCRLCQRLAGLPQEGDQLLAGAAAVGIGSDLTKGTPAQIEERARQYSQKIKDLRS